MADRQPQAGASCVLPCGEKRFKYFGQSIGGDAMAGVTDHQSHGSLLQCRVPAQDESSLLLMVNGPEGFHPQFSAMWHGLNGIHHKIKDHTVERSLISGDRRERFGEIRLEHDPFL